MRYPLDPLMAPYPRARGAFGFQRTPTHKHQGVDFMAPRGTPVLAVGDGVVEHSAGEGSPGFSGYGNVIVIRLSRVDGIRALYAHLETMLVSRGDRVKDGQVIGTVGTSGVKQSGPHLHFELSERAYPQPSESPRLNPAFFFGTPCPTVQS